jgi:hypothetical protein
MVCLFSIEEQIFSQISEVFRPYNRSLWRAGFPSALLYFSLIQCTAFLQQTITL